MRGNCENLTLSGVIFLPASKKNFSTMRPSLSVLAAALFALSLGTSTVRADLVVESATREVRDV